MLKSWIHFVFVGLLSILLAGCFLVPSETKPAATALIPADQINLAAAASATCPVCPTCPPKSPTPVPPTKTLTQTATSTFTPTATFTFTPTATFTPPISPTPTKTPKPKPWMVQANSPVYLQNFAHPESGCNWMGIAGQAFGKDGKTVGNLVVVVSGKLGSKSVDLIGLTGMLAGQAYGPGGYELLLATQPVDSTNALTAQLYNLAGEALTDPFPFNTIGTCQTNLIILNFKAR